MTLKVRENIKYGADVIKFMATGGVLSEGDNPALAQYSPEEMKAIVDTAHGLGRKVAAHAHGALGIKYAVLAGVDSIEHGSYINDEDIELMKQRGTYLVPTVYLEEWLMENVRVLGLTPNMMEKAQDWCCPSRSKTFPMHSIGRENRIRHRRGRLPSRPQCARIRQNGSDGHDAAAGHSSRDGECGGSDRLVRSRRHPGARKICGH